MSPKSSNASARLAAISSACSAPYSFTRTLARKSADLSSWLQDAAASLLASFVNGLRADESAVAAALVEPWSNGQTEGQITKLKLVKRQMYGRAKLDLLRARLIGAG